VLVYSPSGQGRATTSPILRDRVIVDLIDDLETALAVIESTERRSRSRANGARLSMAVVAVDTAIGFIRNLRG
jgi:hypothetical protein